MTLRDYPIKEETFIYATERAKEESLEHPDHFIYLFRSNLGYYLIDVLGFPKFSDERLIATYYKGEKTL
jgi:hypothetical protein